MDWKDQLKAFADANPSLPDGPGHEPESAQAPATPRRNLRYFLERKGRKGKTATIITGFDDCSDDELRETLKLLQKRLGTGGSARGGEILLQGEWIEQARRILENR